jgi:hypothetical protein
MAKRRYGKIWRSKGGTFRYKYSGRFGQWKKLQRKHLDTSRWHDVDDAWRPTRRGEFRRKYQ